MTTNNIKAALLAAREAIATANLFAGISRSEQQLYDNATAQLTAAIEEIDKAEPVAWLYKCMEKQPSPKSVVWSSLDETDHWPVDQWQRYEVLPLYLHPAPAVPPNLDEIALSIWRPNIKAGDFARRLLEELRK